MKFAGHLLISMVLGYMTANAQAPDMQWQKSLGGSAYDDAYSIEQSTDSGYIVCGTTWSIDGDVIGNHGSEDIWVVKLKNEGSILWQKTYGGTNGDEGYSICNTLDGGYIIAGTTLSVDEDVTSNHGGNDAWVIKIDANGIIVWQKSYGGIGAEKANSIRKTNDGGYIFAGYTTSIDGDVSSNHGAEDFWVVKLDETGNIQWQKSFGGSLDERANEINQTPDGGYIIIGYTFSFDGDVWGYHGDIDYWIVKLNETGNMQWQKPCGGSSEERGYSIINASDGGFICTGYTASFDGDVTGHYGAEYTDEWVIKMDSSGAIQWQKCFGGTGGDGGFSIIPTVDNGYVVVGQTTSNDFDVTGHHGPALYGDYWVVKLDTVGIIQWQKALGGTTTEEAYSIKETIDSGFIVAGYTSSDDGDVTGHHGISYNTDYWVVKLGKPCTPIIYFADCDSDGYGDSTHFILSCSDTIGYVLNKIDCNDSVPEINPLAKEICNFIDDNCNGIIDEGLAANTFYADADDDSYGNAAQDTVTCETGLTGFVSDSTDCDDTNPLISPGATELLNGLDDNCNQLIDEGLSIDNLLLNTINIYPNPAENMLFVEYGGNKNASIQIIDFTGKTIYTKNDIGQINEIDVSKYSSAVYLIKIIIAGSEVSFKFVKE